MRNASSHNYWNSSFIMDYGADTTFHRTHFWFSQEIKKCEVWAVRIWKGSKISKFWNKTAMLRWSPHVLAKFGEWVHVPLRKFCRKNNCMRKRTKSSITQPWFIRFHSNCVQSLNAWHPKCFESSRSRGQRSRLGLVITCAKIRNIISNTTGHC